VTKRDPEALSQSVQGCDRLANLNFARKITLGFASMQANIAVCN